jgi:CHAT domain-containing protein
LKGGILNNLGAAFFRAGRFLEAEMILREAIEVWEAIRQSLGEHDLYRVSVFDSQIKTYRHLQQVLVVQGRTNEALEVAEQSRTRALIEIMISRLRPRFGAEAKLTFSTIEQIQETARMRNATLVEYSVIYHSLIGEGQPKNRGSELLIWVIHPTGKISFRSVDITFLKQQNQSLSQLAEQARESIGVRGRDAVSLGYGYQTKVDLERLKQLYQILIEPIISLLMNLIHMLYFFLRVPSF